jgi:hypothetical protein
MVKGYGILNPWDVRYMIPGSATTRKAMDIA